MDYIRFKTLIQGCNTNKGVNSQILERFITFCKRYIVSICIFTCLVFTFDMLVRFDASNVLVGAEMAYYCMTGSESWKCNDETLTEKRIRFL